MLVLLKILRTYYIDDTLGEKAKSTVISLNPLTRIWSIFPFYIGVFREYKMESLTKNWLKCF